MRVADFDPSLFSSPQVGQILSSRPDLLPPPYLSALATLQDGTAPFSTALARAVVESELGASVDSVYSSFSPQPVASASLGQVYKATLRATGEEVAVKVQRPGVAATLARDDDADGLFDCDVGITDVDCAIADSGSLVISTIGRMRNAWITPPIHLAIVFESQILADLVDLFERRNECTTAASTTIITGPSKTADIEGVLVTGVHGPAYVEIVLVADESKHVADAHALIR